MDKYLTEKEEQESIRRLSRYSNCPDMNELAYSAIYCDLHKKYCGGIDHCHKGESEMLTKEEFNATHKDCVAGWNELSVTGATIKPDFLRVYWSRCPACHIASKITQTNGWRRLKPQCTCCPVDVWREIAIKTDESVACMVAGQLYQRWVSLTQHVKTKDIEAAKLVAKQIAELHWTYLPLQVEQLEKNND